MTFVATYRCVKFYYIIGASYSFCLKLFSNSSTARIYSDDGNFFEISGTSIYCSLTKEESCVFAIELSNTQGYTQFLM